MAPALHKCHYGTGWYSALLKKISVWLQSKFGDGKLLHSAHCESV